MQLYVFAGYTLFRKPKKTSEAFCRLLSLRSLSGATWRPLTCEEQRILMYFEGSNTGQLGWRRRKMWRNPGFYHVLSLQIRRFYHPNLLKPLHGKHPKRMQKTHQTLLTSVAQQNKRWTKCDLQHIHWLISFFCSHIPWICLRENQQEIFVFCGKKQINFCVYVLIGNRQLESCDIQWWKTVSPLKWGQVVRLPLGQIWHDPYLGYFGINCLERWKACALVWCCL
jgi:hypothetical protein